MNPLKIPRDKYNPWHNTKQRKEVIRLVSKDAHRIVSENNGKIHILDKGANK